MRPGQPVLTPEGPGVTLRPEKAWWVIFGRTAKIFECAELGEPRETRAVSVDAEDDGT